MRTSPGLGQERPLEVDSVELAGFDEPAQHPTLGLQLLDGFGDSGGEQSGSSLGAVILDGTQVGGGIRITEADTDRTVAMGVDETRYRPEITGSPTRCNGHHPTISDLDDRFLERSPGRHRPADPQLRHATIQAPALFPSAEPRTSVSQVRGRIRG